ncbi:MAG: hypothetical protein ISP10_02985 [Aeromicrobium sp.]|jgi:hypothetical protein|nr:hypothetical protein [Aeromicrobium sp.]
MVYRNRPDIEPAHVWIIVGAVFLGWVSLQAYVALHDSRSPGTPRLTGAARAVMPMVVIGVPVLCVGIIVTYDNGLTPLGVIAGIAGVSLLVAAPLLGLLRPSGR